MGFAGANEAARLRVPKALRFPLPLLLLFLAAIHINAAVRDPEPDRLQASTHRQTRQLTRDCDGTAKNCTRNQPPATSRIRNAVSNPA